MSDPASHAARTVAALTDVALEGLPLTDVDRTEQAIRDDIEREGDEYGAWLLRGEGLV